jgi:hypothetical protein
VATTLIVAADEIQLVDWHELFDAVDGLYVRQNEGYDFAAWARIARDLDMSHTRCLGLVNDSIIGPLNAESFSVAFDRIRASRAHLIGLTDSVRLFRPEDPKNTPTAVSCVILFGSATASALRCGRLRTPALPGPLQRRLGNRPVVSG